MYVAFLSNELSAGLIKRQENIEHRSFEADMRFPTMWYVRPAKPQISLRIPGLIRAFASGLMNIL